MARKKAWERERSGMRQAPRLQPVEHPPVPSRGQGHKLTAGEALAISIAEAALNLVEMLDQTPGNRILILQRHAELSQELDGLTGDAVRGSMTDPHQNPQTTIPPDYMSGMDGPWRG